VVPHDHHEHHEHRNVTARPVIEPPSEGREKLLEWMQVSLEFGGRMVINDVTTWVESGQLTCLCGANGAGKTQLIRMGLGFNRPSLGTVKLLGGDPAKQRRLVGYVPQMKAFNRNFPATVEDVLVAAIRGAWPLFSRKGERELVAASLQRVGGLALLDKDVAVLSGGELQRVFMARAMMQNPRLLIMDEPLAAIDAKGRAQLMDLMEELKVTAGMTLLLITHSEPVVRRLADQVIFLEKGHLVGWGATQRMLAIEELREVAFFGHDHESVIHGEEA
jgi:zinc transport system ATP-binding protein